MQRTEDVRIVNYSLLPSPTVLAQELPGTEAARRTVVSGREQIQNILTKKDPRMLLIVGPCSIHEEKSAFEYGQRLLALSEKVKDSMVIVMRVYFEKPRTTVGWKGLINDPNLDGSCDIHAGLRKARKILLKITEMGLPTATEFLEAITPQYIADLVCWAAVGARTTESQTHREMASGLSMPVGFKNGTDGNLASAVNALIASRAPQGFLGIDRDGYPSVVKTAGNPYGHLVLRGGRRPNYDPISIEEARLSLITEGLPDAILVDCSHGNSKKKYQGQGHVWHTILDQRIGGNDAIIGMMLESHLSEGNQKFSPNLDELRYGVSITDQCISWETTESLVLSAHEKLRAAGLPN